MDLKDYEAERPWRPPDKLKAILDSAIAGRLEAVRTAESQQRGIVKNDLAGRGLQGSGFGAKKILQALQPEFKKYAEGVVDDLLGRFREAYRGEIPSEAEPWIRETFEERVMRLAPRLARTVAEHFLPQGQKDGGERSEWNGEAYAAKRRLDQELLMVDLRREMNRAERVAASVAGNTTPTDVFICHASEDKDAAAVPLAQALERLGLSVWIDRAQVTVGDDLLGKIEDGLRSCGCAAVIVSPNFFRKHWTKIELSALATLQEVSGRKVILPVWHNIDKAEVAKHSLLIASLYALSTANGIEAVAAEIASVIRSSDDNSRSGRAT